ncbi:MAG: tetratricopeptide repeat protein [Paludibacteraceae bacterium]|nr:tetratricopeptide repeat protein [Paludibacteraceae bacterium]
MQSRENGDFSLLLNDFQNGDPYAISAVIKAGYEPADQELIGKKIPCSDKVPIEILLVSRAQLMQEKEEIAAKARENVELFYQQRLSELEQQLEAKKLSEQEFNTRLEQLEGQYERFEPLLQSMSDKFARTDYGRLDSLTSRIQEAIEQGNPELAERLVREKGDLDARENAIREQEQQIARAQQTLDEAAKRLDEQREVTAKQKRELAEDYYRLYASFLSRFQNDSAALYIQRRAALDTLNVDYQLQAGQFVKDILADYPLAQSYFERAYRIAQNIYGEHAPQMATTCHELGAICKLRGKTDDALKWYQRALTIKEEVRGKDSPAVAETLNDLGETYRALKDLKQAMNYHQRALKIREKAFGGNSLEVAESKNNIAGIHYQNKHYDKAETLFREVQAVYESNPKTPPVRLADNALNLGGAAYKQGRYDEALKAFEQALEQYTRVLGPTHPRTKNAAAFVQAAQKKIETQK